MSNPYKSNLRIISSSSSSSSSSLGSNKKVPVSQPACIDLDESSNDAQLSDSSTDKLEDTDFYSKTFKDKTLKTNPSKNFSLNKEFLSSCLGRNCPIEVNIKNSLFCSTLCLEQYVDKQIRICRHQMRQLCGLENFNLSDNKNLRFILIERCSGNMLADSQAPTLENLYSFLQAYPTYEIIRQKNPRSRLTLGSHKDSANNNSKRSLDKLQKELHPSRVKNRQFLFDIFEKRVRLDGELIMKNREILDVASSLESAVFKFYNETNLSYNAKVRLIGSHLKLSSNKGLYRRLLTKNLLPEAILKLSSEQLSSIEDLGMGTGNESSPITIKASSGCNSFTEKDESEIGSLHKNIINYHEANKSVYDCFYAIKDTAAHHAEHFYDVNCSLCRSEHKSNEKKFVEDDFSVEPHKENSVASLNLEYFSKLEATSSPQTLNKTKSNKKVTFGKIYEKHFSPDPFESTVDNTPAIAKTPSFSKNRSKDWEGALTMTELGTLNCYALTVSKKLTVDTNNSLVCLDMPNMMQVVGRTSVAVFLDYVSNINGAKKGNRREVVVVELRPDDPIRDMAMYRQFFEYFHSRKRVGVVGNTHEHVKDLYIYPLPANSSVPSMLLPFQGPGLDSQRANLLLAVVIRSEVVPTDESGPTFDMSFLTKVDDSPSPEGFSNNLLNSPRSCLIDTEDKPKTTECITTLSSDCLPMDLSSDEEEQPVLKTSKLSSESVVQETTNNKDSNSCVNKMHFSQEVNYEDPRIAASNAALASSLEINPDDPRQRKRNFEVFSIAKVGLQNNESMKSSQCLENSSEDTDLRQINAANKSTRIFEVFNPNTLSTKRESSMQNKTAPTKDSDFRQLSNSDELNPASSCLEKNSKSDENCNLIPGQLHHVPQHYSNFPLNYQSPAFFSPSSASCSVSSSSSSNRLSFNVPDNRCAFSRSNPTPWMNQNRLRARSSVPGFSPRSHRPFVGFRSDLRTFSPHPQNRPRAHNFN